MVTAKYLFKTLFNIMMFVLWLGVAPMALTCSGLTFSARHPSVDLYALQLVGLILAAIAFLGISSACIFCIAYLLEEKRVLPELVNSESSRIIFRCLWLLGLVASLTILLVFLADGRHFQLFLALESASALYATLFGIWILRQKEKELKQNIEAAE
ncbi:MAG: hypothetical protein NTW79_01095 [Candidatus Berkelbacteria bacterium]|nr:hypothetical protein [Candidatus Berkelbacteria bacterium]